MTELDYSQHQCPYPVVETRKQLLANPTETISVLVGDQTAKENVSRLANKMGYQVEEEAVATNYRMVLTPATSSNQQPPQPKVQKTEITGDTVVYCGSDQMGQGAEEFGIELWEHVGNVIEAMRRIAPELGLAG